MENLIEILWILFWNILVPILIGYSITMFLNTDSKNNLALNFSIGLIAMFGIFQPITLVGIYFNISLTLLTNIMKVIWILLSVISLLMNAKRILLCLGHVKVVLKNSHLYIVLAILLFVIQAYAYVGYQHIDDDDAFFVATATTAVANDNLYVRSPYTGALYTSLPTRYILSPFSIFYAVMSQITDMHATIYAHLYLPVILLLFVYLVYYLWGKEWFNNSQSLGIFLIFISFLNIFGNYTQYSTQTFLLSRLWQGKAILAAGIIPFILYLCYKIRKEDRLGVYWITLLLCTSAATLVSSMGVFLAPVTIGCFALADCIQSRKIKRLIGYFLSCIPCMICGIIYIIIT